MAHTFDQVQAELTNVMSLMEQAHARWIACDDTQRDLFGTSEHDFWYDLWRTLDNEGLRLLAMKWSLRPNTHSPTESTD